MCRRVGEKLVVVAVLGCLTASAACSWLVVKTPPAVLPDRPIGPIHCTESREAPVMDTVLAAGWVGVTLACGIAGVTFNDGRPAGPYGAAAAIMLLGACALPAVGLGLTHTISAMYGFHHTKRCRELHLRLPETRPPSSPRVAARNSTVGASSHAAPADGPADAATD